MGIKTFVSLASLYESLSLFSASAPLRRHQLISVGRTSDPTEQLQACPISLPLRVLSHLVGNDRLDEQLAPYARLVDCDIDPAQVALAPSAMAGGCRSPRS